MSDYENNVFQLIPSNIKSLRPDQVQAIETKLRDLSLITSEYLKKCDALGHLQFCAVFPIGGKDVRIDVKIVEGEQAG